MNSQIALIFVLLGLLMLWVVYFSCYKQYRIEETRMKLFSIRNELFDYAMAGSISFNHPAYGLLREIMNSMIRFTHKIDWVTLILLYMGLRNIRPIKGKFEMFIEELNTLPDEVKKELSKYLRHMDTAITSHLIKSSILMMSLTVIFGLYVLIRQGCCDLNNLKNEIKKQLPTIDQVNIIAAELG